MKKPVEKTDVALSTEDGIGNSTVDFIPISEPAIIVAENLTDKTSGYEFLKAVSIGPRYTRSSLHASGGMGNVWLAKDRTIGREVAVKELRAEGEQSGRAALRFVHEARITGQLEHPGVVPVYELGTDPESGRPFYVMRYIRGRTLTEVANEFHERRLSQESDPMELVKLLSAFVSVCNTIAYAHSHGIIHRDLKGENIVLGEFGEAIVLDWGLAKALSDKDVELEGVESPATGEVNKTVMGQIIGTPAYMAPEQAEGRNDLVGTATDIFGLGAILYEILTGKAPFGGTTATDVVVSAIRSEVLPPRKIWDEVPPGLEAVCLKAMARNQEDRYSSALELGRVVEGWQDRQRRLAEAELRQAFERMQNQQAAVVALTHADVFAGPDLQAIFQRLVEVTARTLGVERVSIWRFTPNRKSILCHALFELTPNRHTSGVELASDAYPNYFEALAATEVIAADDAQTDPRTNEFTEGYLKPLGIGAMMEVPIPPDGVLCHEHVGSPRKWLPDEQLFGIAVGHLAAHAISQSERRQAIEELKLARGQPDSD